jgi:PST family polysaccharide transporter
VVERRSAFGGVAKTLGGQWIKFAIQIATLALLARLVSPSDYGLITMVVAITSIATLLSDFGLSSASIQAERLSTELRSNLFWLNVMVGLALAGIVALSAPLIAAFYDQPEVEALTRALSLVFLLNAMGAQFKAELSRTLRFGALAVVDVGAQLTASGVALGLAFNGMGLWALAAQQIVLALVSGVGTALLARWVPRFHRPQAGLRSLLKYGANTLGVQVLTYATGNIDSILLGKYWGPSALGLYDRAYQLFRLPLQQVAGPLTRVGFPVFARLQTSPRFEQHFRSAHLLVCYFMGLPFYLSIGLSAPIVQLVLGSRFAGSATIFQLLAIGGIFQAATFAYSWAFMALGATGLQLRFTVWTRLLMILFIVAGLPWGALGVALGSAIGLAINWAILTFVAISRLGLSSRALAAQSCGPFLVGTVVAATAYVAHLWVAGSGGNSAVSLVAAVTAAMLGALALILLVAPLRAQVLRLLAEIKKMRRRGADPS